jgi:signal transduction histidine kinase
LLKILDHLLDNAVKFTHTGEISLAYLTTAEYIKFSVRDEGIGIAAEKIDLIFQNFTKVEDSETSIYEGTGLGLSISKGLVQLLGGDISVESLKGVGSIFYVKLLMK